MNDLLKTFLISPEYWPWAIFLLPVLAMIGVVYYRQRKAISWWFESSDLSFFIPEAKLVMRGAVGLLLLVALLGPFWGRMEQEIPMRGREVYFLIDVSASMNCEDIKPNRLEKVKRELKRSIEQMNGDRVGLIVFTSDAYVQCPLTSDIKAANLFLDLVGTAQFSNSGTNFREALQMALTRFAESEDSTEVRRKLSRSIVLISDGEDFGGEYTSVVGRLKDHDIKVFTVGVGTYEGAQVPDYRNGQKVGYKRGEDGGQAISQLKDATLQDIASTFGTEYLAMDDQFDNFDPVVDQIKMLSAQELDRQSRYAEVNRYQWFLGLGAVLFVVTLFWMPISASRRSRGR